MRHGEARERLEKFASGALPQRLRAEVAAHVDECTLCEGWLATYSRLEAQVNGSSYEHPDADTLAAYAVEPFSLRVDERTEVETHLRDCSDCRTDHRLSRLALTQAQDGEAGLVHRVWRWQLAAGLAAAALLAVAIVVWRPVADGGERTIARVTLGGSQVVEAQDRLFATQVEVGESAHVILRATDAVALGEGFSVKQGGKLVIGTTVPQQRTAKRES